MTHIKLHSGVEATVCLLNIIFHCIRGCLLWVCIYPRADNLNISSQTVFFFNQFSKEQLSTILILIEFLAYLLSYVLDEEKSEDIDSNNSNKKSKEDLNNNSKGKKKSSPKSKTKSANSPHPDLGPGTEQKIDLDKMMEESHKLPPGQKRKYRTLDTMTIISGTALYLVLILVFKAEFFKTSFVTIIYSIFIYMYSGTYV